MSPQKIRAVALTLSRHHYVSWVAAITGSANIAAAVTCHTSHDLFSHVTEDVGSIDGVIHVKIVLLMTRLK